jgi:N-carbamoylputrescine amidase
MTHIMDGPGFHERDYYTPGNSGAIVYPTAIGKLGVAICYDRHFPEYMRALGVKGSEIVVIPQAGAVDEWPSGLFEAECQVASMQNGYFCALANRVGKEENLTFSGESFVTDPLGQVVTRAPKGKDSILYADLDLKQISESPAKRHFLKDRRPEIYPL